MEKAIIVDGELLNENTLHLSEPVNLKTKKVRVIITEALTVNRRTFGSAKGLIKISDDFNEPLDDFSQYMPE